MLRYLVIGGIAIGAPLSLYWVGDKKVHITEKEFPGCTFVYRDFQGHVKHVKKPFKELNKNLVTLKSSQFKIAPYHLMGIYYDDPSLLKDIKKSRAALGFVINEDPTQS